jgi:prevent-host-death family protein
MSKTRMMAASKFKAQCLALMDEVQRTGREITITKRGVPVAKLVPAPEKKKKKSIFGCMIGTGRIVGDVMKPLRYECVENPARTLDPTIPPHWKRRGS